MIKDLHIKSFPYSTAGREKSHAQKITEARRVGTFDKLSVKAPRSPCEPSGARQLCPAVALAKEGLTQFFKMSSNLFKNEHQK
ncbi:MAG: hypothetical protein UW37_C0003G0004 [Candidatus Gottesmanbacteria bacterium GW2011_GWA2_44_17]|uniref:Uncharacterized protein n=2 Tax=Candidatus Gottesmaniibacteriota TaxID=1752720 RepID=A0A0G1JV07_9BACT|nr:MAG: hypothetical protein UW22_C0010G0004 [Candidatus Gottesmanbacteria bacterium GW2011_GWB1_44_11c]KKT47782.1 MAG: hypothetical protein UW37_C0003G0004 [Candidatus Gottesmanbacteria bacterium GW2011_GWA2_44_17]